MVGSLVMVMWLLKVTITYVLYASVTGKHKFLQSKCLI